MKIKLLLLVVALLGALTIVNPAQAQELRFGKAQTVTQGTNATTAVTLNAQTGIITTFSESAAAGASASFTLNNSELKAGQLVIPAIQNYAGTIGTNGIPVVAIQAVTDGSCTVRVTNVAPTNALSGALKIGFLIVQ